MENMIEIVTENSSSIECNNKPITPIKSSLLGSCINERQNFHNGLLTFSTPIQQAVASQLYRSMLIMNSTPKNVQPSVRKPKVNFHSIDDIVYGGKSDDSIDSAYQSISLEKSKDNSLNDNSNRNNEQTTEYDSEYEAENEDKIETVKKVAEKQDSKKNRTTFTDHQKLMLEQYFDRNPYPDPKETEDISGYLSLPENVIKVWFQNKRSRDKQRKFSRSRKSINADNSSKFNYQFLSAVSPYAAVLNKIFM